MAVWVCVFANLSTFYYKFFKISAKSTNAGYENEKWAFFREMLSAMVLATIMKDKFLKEF